MVILLSIGAGRYLGCILSPALASSSRSYHMVGQRQALSLSDYHRACLTPLCDMTGCGLCYLFRLSLHLSIFPGPVHMQRRVTNLVRPCDRRHAFSKRSRKYLHPSRDEDRQRCRVKNQFNQSSKESQSHYRISTEAMGQINQ